MARFNEQGRNIMKLHAVRKAADIGVARGIIADALPPLLASVLPPGQLEAMRQGLLRLPEPGRPHLTNRDMLGAMGICLLSFLSTFPIGLIRTFGYAGHPVHHEVVRVIIPFQGSVWIQISEADDVVRPASG
jgi:hypothetical protein